MSKELNKVLVVGATGGTGKATVQALLDRGYWVTAFSRRADRLGITSERLRTINGDATQLADVEMAVRDQDAVVVTLGISENALRVRLLGTSGTPLHVRSQGTENVIAAMNRHGVRRLVVQSSYGVGATRDRLRWIERLFFSLILAPQIADTETQEVAVKASGLEWIIAQPVHLTDDSAHDMPFASVEGDTRQMKVSRQQVATFLAGAVSQTDTVGHAVALSAA